ncbi:unnamed protein product [Schistosoma rodhaini]|uniref:AD domain-containing protein n=1 Tax=Schistosoma rodhaini TaxID=6188 RepID=A0AA85EQG3_9TREM|nr:unnamed protein product [Schistosoma rodhaini]CAH8682078.1 unnamed protein product [Schistosoma rodhaini]
MDLSTNPSTLIDKMIRLYCIEDKIFSGFLYTVDPKTGNYVLFSRMNEKYQPTIVRREVVERLETLDDEIPSELRKIFDSFTSIDECSLNTSEEMKTTSSATKTLTSDELICQREKIIQLFSLNHLNEVSINDREEVVIHNVVFIKPPYNVDCCSGKNMIILDRVKNLISKLEEDRNNEVE